MNFVVSALAAFASAGGMGSLDVTSWYPVLTTAATARMIVATEPGP